MKLTRLILAVLGCAFMIGCDSSPPDVSLAAPSSPEEHRGRLDAARKISVSAEMNAALATVAKNAAAAGHFDVAKEALDEITESTLCNSAASDAAVALAKTGNPGAAIEIADMITEGAQRNKTLERIATE